MDAGHVFAFLHILAAFWYVAGLTAVQISLVRGWRSREVKVQAASFDEASHYQGVLLVPGAIAAGASGVSLWAQMGYNLIATGWLVLLWGLYLLTLLVLLPVTGLGVRRVRVAALKARKAGRSPPELEAALADNVPLVSGGLATMLLPVMAWLSIFKPF